MTPVTGVGDPRRLAAVDAAELDGPAGDRDLDAVVATLQPACRVPIAVVANPLVADGAIGAYAGMPLIDDGVVLGSVAMFDEVARTFTPGELELLTHQAKLASSVLALRRSSRTDALTGLPNRTLFDDRLAEAAVRHPQLPPESGS